MPICPATKAIRTFSWAAALADAATLAAGADAAVDGCVLLLGACDAELLHATATRAADTMSAAHRMRCRITCDSSSYCATREHAPLSRLAGLSAPAALLARLLASSLIEIDGQDQDDPDEHVLEERRDGHLDQPVREHDRDERAQEGPADRRDPAKEARATDDDGCDRLEVVGLVAGDVRVGVAGDVDDRRHAHEEAHHHEQPERVAVDVDAGSGRRVAGRSDRKRSHAEPGLAQDRS